MSQRQDVLRSLKIEEDDLGRGVAKATSYPRYPNGEAQRRRGRMIEAPSLDFLATTNSPAIVTAIDLHQCGVDMPLRLA